MFTFEMKCPCNRPYFREEQFRTPSQPERKLGLWVDRIGSGVGQLQRSKLRVLGQYAAVYVEQGYGEYIDASGQKATLRPGDVVFCFPDVPCTYYSTQNWKTNWIVWNGACARHLEDAGYVSADTPIVHDPAGDVIGTYEFLTTLMDREDLASVLERKVVVLRMVEGLFRQNQELCSPACSPACSCDRIKHAVEFLTHNYTCSLRINELADMFAMSPTHFRRMFRKYTGKAPKELIRALRISRAKELLCQGYEHKTVAAEVGYDDVGYFMRVFKESTSMTPGEFRKIYF